jgi:ankyrin repeat protein
MKADSVNDVRTVIASGVNANDVTVGGLNQTVLHLAADACADDVAKYLLAQKLDANKQAADGTTPLHRAAKSGCAPVTTLLLDAGAKVDASIGVGGSVMEVGQAGRVTYRSTPAMAMAGTALHWAAYFDKLPVLRLLIERGANVNADDGAGVQPIHYAALAGNMDLVRALVDAKAQWTPQPGASDRQNRASRLT